MSGLPTLPNDDESWIRTDRLELEPLRSAHAGAMYPILSDPKIYEFTGGSPPVSLVSLTERYARWERRRSPDGNELWLNWLIRACDGAVVIGCVQATLTEAGTAVAWVVGSEWQGRGYASEAARALMLWLERSGALRIHAFVNPRHKASQRVAERAGLRRTEQIHDGEEVWVYEPARAAVSSINN